jgi:hypothetical protein
LPARLARTQTQQGAFSQPCRRTRTVCIYVWTRRCCHSCTCLLGRVSRAHRPVQTPRAHECGLVRGPRRVLIHTHLPGCVLLSFFLDVFFLKWPLGPCGFLYGEHACLLFERSSHTKCESRIISEAPLYCEAHFDVYLMTTPCLHVLRRQRFVCPMASRAP